MLGVILFLLLSLLIGVATCFFGKRLYFIILMVNVFIVSLAICIDIFGAETAGILISIAIAAVLAVLARVFFRVGVFLMGAIGGAALGTLVARLLPAAVEPYTWIFMLVFALLIGICAVKWSDLFIMLSTSFSGASTLSSVACFLVLNIAKLSQFVSSEGLWQTVTKLNDYMQGDFASGNSTLLLIVTLVIAVIGFLFQRRQAKAAGTAKA